MAGTRYTFQQGGFDAATREALEQARRQVVEAAEAANRRIVQQYNPTSVSHSVDGVKDAPLDNVKL